MTEPMYELSLFSGCGGGLLGTKLLGWKTIGYVENDEYCQKVIKKRIKDKYLDEAPIFSDIETFINQGYADSYSGMVDIITAGFPCQPFSNAGKKLSGNDNKNKWPETIECIRRIRPEYVYLENVPGLLYGSHGYFGKILSELAQSGYDARWRMLSAAEMGAPHKRNRVWIVAYANGQQEHISNCTWKKSNDFERNGENRTLGNTIVKGLQNRQSKEIRASAQFVGSSWWEIEPGLGRVANGVANRVDRLKCIGNGQVPIVAAAAWRLLTEEL